MKETQKEKSNTVATSHRVQRLVRQDELPPRVHDWIEDFPHENGRYDHQCRECNSLFQGHKRRSTCKVCGDANQAKWNALTDAQKQKRYADIEEYLNKPNVKLTGG